MKSLIKIFAMFIMMSFASMVIAPLKSSAQASVSFQVFYDDLSPYGNWVYYSNHGYVWIPDYGSNFVPYHSNGYWAYTDYGWTWVSYYRWGWAPFHYGRWAYDDMYGWFWIPDDVWGPAWVSWRTGPGYYGWVPLGPGVTFGFAIGGSYNPPSNYWVFVNSSYMGSTNIYQYYRPRKSNSDYISNSQVVNNTYKNNYIAGPKKEDVEKSGGKEIKQVSIKERDNPGQSIGNNELSIYKPNIAKGKDENAKPAKVTELKEVKPVSERKASGNGNDIKKKEPAMKKEEPKEKIIKSKEQPNNEKKVKQEQPPKMAQPKEIKKQEQPPKMVQPKMNENKNIPNQPPKEIKRQEKPPRMVQPNTNPNQNPGSQPHHNQGGQQKRPR